MIVCRGGKLMLVEQFLFDVWWPKKAMVRLVEDLEDPGSVWRQLEARQIVQSKENAIREGGGGGRIIVVNTFLNILACERKWAFSEVSRTRLIWKMRASPFSELVVFIPLRYLIFLKGYGEWLIDWKWLRNEPAGGFRQRRKRPPSGATGAGESREPQSSWISSPLAGYDKTFKWIFEKHDGWIFTKTSLLLSFFWYCFGRALFYYPLYVPYS